MMRNNVYTTPEEEMVSGYRLNPRQLKAKKDRQANFDKQHEKKRSKKR